MAQKQETELDVLQRLWNKGARKREEREVVLGTLLKLIVKDKLLHSGITIQFTVNLYTINHHIHIYSYLL